MPEILPSESLNQWFLSSKDKGLVDIKMFISPDPDVSTEERCSEVIRMVNAYERGDYVDVTGQKF